MDDEHANQAHAHLGHLVVVGVEHEGAVLPERELVFRRVAGLDVGLRQAPTPSMPFGRKILCQWTEVATDRRLVT